MKFSLILESGISLGKMVYPKFGNIVILAGGSGSGKGFVKDKLLLMDGKTFDIDSLKGLIVQSDVFNESFWEYLRTEYVSKNDDLDNRAKYILKNKIKPSELDLKDPLDTSILHFFTFKKDYDNRLKKNFFLNALKTDRKPNVIFDITLRDKGILDLIYDYALLGQYNPENIHLVWVLNDVEVAKIQNNQRDRRVQEEILVSTHKGVSLTMKEIVKDFENTKTSKGTKISDIIKGDIWIVPNRSDDSIIDNNVFISFNSFKLKESGKSIKTIKEVQDERVIIMNRDDFKETLRTKFLGSDLQKKIDDYVPKDAQW